MDLPKVAVVMPMRNAEKTIKAALDSVFYQTYGNIVLIVVNDGTSLDESEDIVGTFAQQAIKKGLPVILQRYLGPRDSVNNISRVLNQGFVRALKTGAKYIARMDADDECSMDRIEEQVAFMESRPWLGMCGTWATVVAGIGDVNHVIEDFHPRIPSGDERKWLVKFNYFIHGSVMIKAEVLNKIGLYHTDTVVEDYDLWFRIANTADIAVLQKPLYVLNRGGYSWSTGKADAIYNVAKQQREFWSKAWNIPIPDHDLPDYCTQYPHYSGKI